MLVATCNRCGKPVKDGNFAFYIHEHNISGSTVNIFNGPEVRLDDFHLCSHCMSDFVDWIKDGKKE